MLDIFVILLMLPGFLFLVVIVLMMVIKQREIYKIHRDGICDRCGYNLTGNTSGVCPECGLAFH